MKLHRLLWHTIALAGLLLPVGCSDDWEKPAEEPAGADGYINITLRSSRLTRATEDGLDEYNENTIESAVLLLYPDDGTAGAQETYQPTVSQVFTGLTANQTAVLQVILTDAAKNRLFGNNGTSSCRAIVFTNLPQNVLGNITAKTTADDIKKMTVTSPFESNEVQQSFVMDGSGEVTLAADGKSASGTVDVQRVAAKITLSIRVPESITMGEGEQQTTWNSQRSNMRAAIMNGVKTSAVVPSNHTNADGDYYSMPTQATSGYGPRSLNLVEGVSPETGYPYIVNIPFYTYPNSWTEGAEETHRTFITLMVPWREGDTGPYRTSYYQVPINRGTSIARNVSYRINLNVGVLGSFTPDEPFQLEDCSYTAVDWSRENIDVSISDYRYLVVDQEYYTINNEPSISIPLYSSHPVVVQNVTATYYRYYVTAQGNEYPVTITQEVNQATKDYSGNNGRAIWTCTYVPNSETDANGLLNLNHEMIQWTPYRRNYNRYSEILQAQLATYAPENNLNNYQIAHFRPTTNAEYSRVEFVITITHYLHPEYSQTIRIVQYPAIYIDATQNRYSGSQNLNGQNGNTYINGNCLNSYNGYGSWSADNWCNSPGLPSTGGGTTNANPNQYVISIGNLDSNTNYIIGDPRSHEPVQSPIFGMNTYNGNSTIQTNPNNAWANVLDLDGTRRGLTYYYPTSSNVQYSEYIAPKIRIASSYGRSQAFSYSDAQKRCAGYQEMSRPAGRWRIPTVAEIEYIIGLSVKGYIPELFTRTTSTGWDTTTSNYYWTAQGRITPNTDVPGVLTRPQNTTGDAHVRCVYDEWYWGNDTIPGTGTGAANRKTYPFTWGDREIDFSESNTRAAKATVGAKNASRLIDIIRNK